MRRPVKSHPGKVHCRSSHANKKKTFQRQQTLWCRDRVTGQNWSGNTFLTGTASRHFLWQNSLLGKKNKDLSMQNAWNSDIYAFLFQFLIWLFLMANSSLLIEISCSPRLCPPFPSLKPGHYLCILYKWPCDLSPNVHQDHASVYK